MSEPIAWLSEYDGHTSATADPDTVRIWRETLGRKITALYAADEIEKLRNQLVRARSRKDIYRAIESNVSSEPDKHFIDRRWMTGINDAVDAILALSDDIREV